MHTRLSALLMVVLSFAWTSSAFQDSPATPAPGRSAGAQDEAAQKAADDAAFLAQRGNLRIRLDYYELIPKEEVGAALPVDELAASAATFESLNAALAKLGKVSATYRVDHAFSPSSESKTTAGANVPIAGASRRGTDGATTTSVQYQEVGLILEMHAGPFMVDLNRCELKFTLETSSVGESKVQVAPDVFAPVFRKFEHNGVALFELGAPQVLLLSESGQDGDAAAVCRVARMELVKG